MFKKFLILVVILCFSITAASVFADEENVSYFTGYGHIICKHHNVQDFELASKALHSENIKDNYFSVIGEDGSMCAKTYVSEKDIEEVISNK